LKEQLQHMSEDEEEMLAPSSDDSSHSEDSDSGTDWDVFLEATETMLTNDLQSCEESGKYSDNMDGLHWEYNGSINAVSQQMMVLRGTQLKQGMEGKFNTPFSSMMSIFPLFFWDIIVNKINRYAAQKIKKQLEAGNTKRPRLLCGYKWKDVTCQEIMTYFCILYVCHALPTNRQMNM